MSKSLSNGWNLEHTSPTSRFLGDPQIPTGPHRQTLSKQILSPPSRWGLKSPSPSGKDGAISTTSRMLKISIKRFKSHWQGNYRNLLGCHETQVFKGFCFLRSKKLKHLKKDFITWVDVTFFSDSSNITLRPWLSIHLICLGERLEVQRCCFECFFRSRVPPRVLQKQLLRPTRHLWNQQPTINHRQAAVLIIPLCLDLHALTGLQLNNHSSQRQFNIKGEATIPGPTGPSLIMFRKSWQSHQTPSLAPQQLDTQKLAQNDEKFPYFPPPANPTHGWRICTALTTKKTHTHTHKNKFPDPTVGLPLH